MAPTGKRRHRWMRSIALLATAVALLFLSLEYSNRLIQRTQSATLFCYYQNLWMTVSSVPAHPVDLGAFFKGELWLATEDGVSRFNGSHWIPSPQALRGKRPAALATGDGVWVLSQDGYLAHFDGQGWTMEGLAGKLPGVKWGPRPSERPTLVAAEDGSLWILWDGLWHRSNGVWTEVRPQGEEVIGAKLVGESSGHAWLAREGEVETVTLDGKVDTRLRPDNLGPAARSIYRVIPFQGALWMATQAGFVVYDGTSWRNLGAPPNTGGMLDAGPAFDGGLFVIGAQPPAGVSTRLVLALPVILLSGSALTLLAYLAYRMVRGRRNRGLNVDAPARANAGFDPRNRLATSWTRDALQEGDCAGALRKLGILAMGLPSRHMLLLQAAVLSLAGALEDAEECCRRAIGHDDVNASPFALDRLGAVLTAQGKYGEARETLEKAMRLDESFDLACADMAELLLREAGDAAMALEFAERALAANPSSAQNTVGRQPLAEARALRAWALAALGKSHEAQSAVQRALDAANLRDQLPLAGIYWRIGMALERAGDHNAAMSHFRSATIADKHGKYGALARAQLAERSAWGVSA